ncbi:MAG TPA: hypothetical protein VLJ79_20370, partial [Candidatus Binatia bacterium]|nr:hypothetical protein [Candidatus Binatia bacterium]
MTSGSLKSTAHPLPMPRQIGGLGAFQDSVHEICDAPVAMNDKPHTPLERLLNCPEADRTKTEELKRLRNQTDPFELAKRIEQKLERIYQMA